MMTGDGDTPGPAGSPTATTGSSRVDAAGGSGGSSPRASTVPRIAGPGQLAARAQLVMRARVPRPAVQGLLALAVYLGVFIIVYAFPLVRHPGLPWVAQAQVDPNFYIWSWRWWPYAISHGLNPLYSRQIGAPAGYNLAWTTPVPAAAVLLSPVTAAFGPIVSFNLSLLLSAPVSAWAAFVATRRLTGRFWAALMAGTVYGFSWYEVAETGAGHPNLYVIMLLPLMLYLALLWRDGKLGSRWFVGLTALAMAAEFYISDETFAAMTVLGAAALLIGFALARPAERRTIARLARLAGLAFVLAIAAASPYLVYALRHSPPRFTKVQPAFSLNLEDLVNPGSGIVLLVIALALAMLAWSSRLTRLLVVMFALIVVAAIGPVAMAGTRRLGSVPWERLWYLPLARSSEPLRLMIFGYLVLAIIVAVWLAMPARSRLLLAFRWILGLAAVGLIIANVPTASRASVIPAGTPSAAVRPTDALPAFISSGRYRDYLRPGEIVVVVSDRGNAGMLFQADTDFYFRIAGGFINRSLSTATGLPVPVQALRRPTPARERRFLAYVRQAGVGAILVERAWAAPWMNVFGRMGLHGTPAGGVIVYRTT
jgi:hypothetical protein